MARPAIAGVVLAAGESSRMGRPKALLEIEGTTFIHRIIAIHRAAKIERVIVVLGAHEAEIRDALTNEHVEIIVNARWREGRLGSLIAGITAAEEKLVDAIVMHPVDHPCVKASTIVALCDAFANTGAKIVRPVYQSKHGHPVLFASDTFVELRAASPEQGAREVVHRHAGDCVDVAVDDDGVMMNIDTPEQYEHLRGHLPGH